MKTPTWETSAGALAAFLNTATQGYLVDLFSFTLSGGQVLRYTSADVPVTVNGTTFACGPLIKRGNTNLSLGISVDSLDCTLSPAPDGSTAVNGVPLMQFIAGGGFDGARLLLERAYASAPPVLNTAQGWIGTLGLFQGRVSAIARSSRYEAQLTVNSDAELLNVMVPRNVYQPGCSNTLFDAACGLSKAANAWAATATSASDAAQSTFSTALANAAGFFDLGFVVGVTGPNAGVARTIKQFSGGTITTIQPWPVAVVVGNTFTAYPGCDKTQATCTSKFANVLRFRGQPYIPAPETIL
jgi:uncharacterized phage protein (TIGR02218 family)